MIAIELHLAGNLNTVKADPVQIEQILLNLGSNAADSMPEGGRLVIKTENVTLDKDFVSSHLGAVPGSYLLLTVSDTGRGMDRETMEHIFEPFFTTKKFGKGTGLGLASVYGIVKRHGGYINCYSEPGQGTLFKIYLPASGQDEGEIAREAETPPRGGNETILVVDDEEAIRKFASTVLVRYGYRVLTAADGEQALETYAAANDPIDLVILDIGMPGMGGLACLRELLKIDLAVKVLIASGYSINDQIRQALDAGASAYVSKPYQLNDLLKNVRAMLDGAQPAAP